MRFAFLVLTLAMAFGGAASAAEFRHKGLFLVPQTLSPRTPGIAAEPSAAAGPASSLSQSGLGRNGLAQSIIPPFTGGFSTGGLATLGLPAVGEQAPQCRAQCTKDRLTCGEDTECESSWAICVVACGSLGPR